MHDVKNQTFVSSCLRVLQSHDEDTSLTETRPRVAKTGTGQTYTNLLGW
jgi:hypothetical protein